MHIEKINDNQIKCTLSQRDLLARQLNLNELAYGTEKARSLFQEMLEHAHNAFGFEAENMPLMVEAIPLPTESIVLIITRIDSPDELDTRFSRFTAMANDGLAEEDEERMNGADEILDLFHSVLNETSLETQIEETSCFSESNTDETEMDLQDFTDQLTNLANTHAQTADSLTQSADKQLDLTGDSLTADVVTNGEVQKPINLMRIYSFHDLDTLTELAQVLHSLYNGVNSLYKDDASGTYYLVVYQSHHSPAEFNKTCNIILEYGEHIKSSLAREAFYIEHYRCIVSQTALQRLYLF